MSNVTIVFTGGTIASQFDPQSGGHRAALGASAILTSTAGLADIARIDPVDWGRVPASQITFSQILELAGILNRALARDDVDGAVLVQGTDSIEETSIALDLLIENDKPLVITGSMRNSDQDGYEGGANLRDAVRCASSVRMRGQGVVVVMAGEVHAAEDVVKSHPEAYDTFRSPNWGPLGRISGNEISLGRQRVRRRHLETSDAAEPVYLITSVVGADGSLIRLAQRNGARGFVIAGAGTGNTPIDMLEACRVAIHDGIPVVLVTRCPTGQVVPAYSFPGAGAQWRDAGAVLAGPLTGPKARMVLALGVGAGLNAEGLSKLFAH